MFVCQSGREGFLFDSDFYFWESIFNKEGSFALEKNSEKLKKKTLGLWKKTVINRREKTR